ncbi:MAG: hypothetical protein WKF96_20020 [Solirubrobacteraceae bacterium]
MRWLNLRVVGVVGAREGLDNVSACEVPADEDVRAVADVLRPVFDRTGGVDDSTSLKVAPDLDAGVDLDEVTERRLAKGIEAFETAMGKMLASIERRGVHPLPRT